MDMDMDGKRLAQLIKQLDKIAIKLGVKPLSSFISSDPEDAALFSESHGMDPEDIKIPPLEQFSANNGLNTINKLREHPIFELDEMLKQDLNDCYRILSNAASKQIKWHFEVDF